MSNFYRALSPEDKVACVEETKQGVSAEAVCSKYGISVPTLRLYCREAGVVRHKWLTPSEKALIASLIQEGRTHFDIAKEIGKTQSTIAGYVQRAGLTSRGGYYPAERIDQLMELIKTVSVTAAAKQLGMSPNRARSFINTRQGKTNGIINQNAQGIHQVDAGDVGSQESHIEHVDGQDDVGGSQDQ